SLSSTTSSAKSCCSEGSLMALPPYLMTMVLPWKRRMYGSASARISALSRGAMWLRSGEFGGRVAAGGSELMGGASVKAGTAQIVGSRACQPDSARATEDHQA